MVYLITTAGIVATTILSTTAFLTTIPSTTSSLSTTVATGFTPDVNCQPYLVDYNYDVRYPYCIDITRGGQFSLNIGWKGCTRVDTNGGTDVQITRPGRSPVSCQSVRNTIDGSIVTSVCDFALNSIVNGQYSVSVWNGAGNPVNWKFSLDTASTCTIPKCQPTYSTRTAYKRSLATETSAPQHFKRGEIFNEYVETIWPTGCSSTTSMTTATSSSLTTSSSTLSTTTPPCSPVYSTHYYERKRQLAVETGSNSLDKRIVPLYSVETIYPCTTTTLSKTTLKCEPTTRVTYADPNINGGYVNGGNGKRAAIALMITITEYPLGCPTSTTTSSTIVASSSTTVSSGSSTTSSIAPSTPTCGTDISFCSQSVQSDTYTFYDCLSDDDCSATALRNSKGIQVDSYAIVPQSGYSYVYLFRSTPATIVSKLSTGNKNCPAASINAARLYALSCASAGSSTTTTASTTATPSTVSTSSTTTTISATTTSSPAASPSICGASIDICYGLIRPKMIDYYSCATGPACVTVVQTYINRPQVESYAIVSYGSEGNAVYFFSGSATEISYLLSSASTECKNYGTDGSLRTGKLSGVECFASASSTTTSTSQTSTSLRTTSVTSTTASTTSASTASQTTGSSSTTPTTTTTFISTSSSLTTPSTSTSTSTSTTSANVGPILVTTTASTTKSTSSSVSPTSSSSTTSSISASTTSITTSSSTSSSTSVFASTTSTSTTSTSKTTTYSTSTTSAVTTGSTSSTSKTTIYSTSTTSASTTTTASSTSKFPKCRPVNKRL